MTDYSELKRLAEESVGFCDVPIAPDVVLGLIYEVEGLSAQHGRDSAELRSLCQARDDARKERDQLKAEVERLKNRLEVDPRHDYDGISTRDATVKVLDEQVDQLKAENERLKAESEQAKLISRIAYNFDGYKAVLDERDQLRAEVAGLKTGYEAYEQVNAELKAEVEGLRREREGKVLCDSANTEADEHRQCMATYRPLRQANLDSVVKKCDDLLAAMGNGEQS